MRPRRYQLRKDALEIIANDHPWIFREQLSTAASVFQDGDWLQLVDHTNRVVGFGMYEAEGAIAIRILRRGPDRPDARWLDAQLQTALARRAPLAERTDGIRLVHGESDGIAAVVVDRFGDTLVASSYSAGADALARYVTRALVRIPAGAAALPAGAIQHAVLRPAHRRAGTPQPVRAMRGTLPEVARIVEDGVSFAVDLAAGQKTGTYLDLRALRRAIALAPLEGARVLNLFAYSGMLGRVAEVAGAAAITQVDASERALAFAAAHHVTDPARHTFVTADVFEWLPALTPTEPYDLVIVDPPSMTSKMHQIRTALAAYRKLYVAAARHVRPGGVVVAACCTSRIDRPLFQRTVRDALGGGFKLERELAPEIDHPVGFPQADYLKIGWWRRVR